MVTMITIGANKKNPDAWVRFTASFENIIKQNWIFVKGDWHNHNISVDIPWQQTALGLLVPAGGAKLVYGPTRPAASVTSS